MTAAVSSFSISAENLAGQFIKFSIMDTRDVVVVKTFCHNTTFIDSRKPAMLPPLPALAVFTVNRMCA
jgi:hypothetical protein